MDFTTYKYKKNKFYFLLSAMLEKKLQEIAKQRGKHRETPAQLSKHKQDR